MKEKLIASLAEALEMETNQIRVENEFRSFENYSSLTELSILALLDSEYGIEIEMGEFNKYLTVADLLQLVTSRSAK